MSAVRNPIVWGDSEARLAEIDEAVARDAFAHGYHNSWTRELKSIRGTMVVDFKRTGFSGHGGQFVRAYLDDTDLVVIVFTHNEVEIADARFTALLPATYAAAIVTDVLR